jgi:GPI ethanolamine phosphate transferase 3 subunit O
MAKLLMFLMVSILSYATFLFFHLNGFLLTKKEMPAVNRCKVSTIQYLLQPLNSIQVYVDNGVLNSSNIVYSLGALNFQEIVIPQRPKRLFFIIVDALRLDFMTLHEEPQQAYSQSFNQLPIIHALLLQNQSQCGLFGFRADNPTTTSQRLKGIVTGGLPTFVEIGTNFNSGQVSEDSLLIQWVAHSKKIAILGDDTWTQLFPVNMFWRAQPLDSFNTRDLYTVDNGILATLDNYLLNCSQLHDSSSGDDSSNNAEECRWDVLIAHFLGVAHVGHTHSAHHAHMTERLQAMNEVINKAVSNIPDDALLVVMGDHGMTDEGEHGETSKTNTVSPFLHTVL